MAIGQAMHARNAKCSRPRYHLLANIAMAEAIMAIIEVRPDEKRDFAIVSAPGKRFVRHIHPAEDLGKNILIRPITYFLTYYTIGTFTIYAMCIFTNT